MNLHLRTDFAASRMFWYIVLSFVSWYFFISFLTLCPIGVQEYIVQSPHIVTFLAFFLTNFYFQTVVVGKDIWCYFSLLKFASTCFVTCVISPGEGSMCPWMHILLLLNGMHYICLLGSIKVSFKSIISLLIFSLDYISLWIILLKVPYYYCIVGISPLIFVNNYLVYSGATKLGVYISVSIVSTWWIDPFIIIWWPSLSHPWWVKW